MISLWPIWPWKLYGTTVGSDGQMTCAFFFFVSKKVHLADGMRIVFFVDTFHYTHVM